MNVEIMDYAKNRVSVYVGDLDTIAKMSIKVVSGDEILTVIYKDYDFKEFDSAGDRIMDFFDYEYEIYDADGTYNLIDIPEFINRKNSYWYGEYMK